MDVKVIKNGNLKATIDLLGAELISYTKDGNEIIYQGKNGFWMKHSPILFPICSGLKNETYKYKNSAFPMQKHGFIRFKKFHVAEKTSSSITLINVSDEETKKSFPFDYSFKVTFTLTNKLEITYSVINNDKKDMYFGIGSHEGYQLYDSFENYYIRFTKKVSLVSSVIEGNLLSHDIRNFGISNCFPLRNEDYQIDAQVFKNIGVNELFLSHKTKGDLVKVSFDGPKHLVIWNQVGAPFVCIEPWFTVADYVDATGDITNKEDIILLSPSMVFSYSHSIEIL